MYRKKRLTLGIKTEQLMVKVKIVILLQIHLALDGTTVGQAKVESRLLDMFIEQVT